MNNLFKKFLILFVSIETTVAQLDGRSLNKESSETAIMNNCTYLETSDELTINCKLPATSYMEILNKNKITSLKTLTLNFDSVNNLSLNHRFFNFQQLNITKLIINYKYANDSRKVNLLKMNSELLYNLNEVKDLQIHGASFLEDNVMRREDIEPSYCGLESLKIVVSDLHQVPYGWLRPCKKLKYLHLSHLRQRDFTKEVRRKVLIGAKPIRTLEIFNCYIEDLEDELSDLENLETLNVAHNQIHFALTKIVLPNLVELDLSHNHIFSSALLSSGIEKQPRLKVLSLDYNTVLDLCDSLGYRTIVEEEDDSVAKWHNPLNDRSVTLNSIQRFSLRGTITTEMCFGHMNMDSLEYIDLSESNISHISFVSLPISKARRLEVNVSGCPITDLLSPGYIFTENDYKQLKHEELRFTGLNLTLPCDCEEYLWLATAVRRRKLILDGVVCEGGQDLATVDFGQFQCKKRYSGSCLYRQYWQDNVTDAVCSDLTSLPKVPGLRKVYASGNLIENITASDLPYSLIYMDLTMNHIARMSEDASKALFNQKYRRMRLYGNPIVCDCENSVFILALMDHFDQVEDYANLTCIGDGRFIKVVNPLELCLTTSRRFFSIIIASLGVFVGVVAIICLLYYRFGKTVKVYLFSKGLCLFCIREEEIDSDRPYDAFISFSHKDEDFVINDLLPGLEKDPYNYSICVHYRNWIAGELIPTQINESVNKSKRTIVILSKSFLDSIWGLLEFRTAHLCALNEGRSRLIIIIVDDILETGNLDGELKSYIRTNTYVKKEDPWFWNKLRYALPHRASQTGRIYRKDEQKVTYVINHGYLDDGGEIICNEDGKVFGNDDPKTNNDQELDDNSTNQENTLEINADFENKQRLLNVTPIGRQVSNDSAIEMPALSCEDTELNSGSSENFERYGSASN